MCGIVGFVGDEQAAPVLLDGLARLEYRGYDSAGLAVLDTEKGLQLVKSKGRLKVLSDIVDGGRALSGKLGVGHTRWATHGEPSDTNAHPHLSNSGRIAVVHNGIIENYMEIKEFLQGQGVTFHSDTDTEVVAQLLDYYYQGDIVEATFKVIHRIEGSYALGILCADAPDQLVAARKDGPLVLGYGDGCNFMASDVTALIKYTKTVSYMEDGELAILTREGIRVYNDLNQPVEKERSTVDWDISDAEKGGYEHFMFKEIMEQPEAYRKAAFPRIRDGRVELEELHLEDAFIRQLDRLYIVACGSSYHVGVVGKYLLERMLRRPVEVLLASEFRYSDPIVNDKSLVVVISQSGETLDTMAALREAKQLGARTLAIVNVMGSSIAKEADSVLYTWAGPEIAVATTKAYSTQLVVLTLLGLHFARVMDTMSQKDIGDILEQMRLVPTKMEEILSHTEEIQYFASQYFNHESIFFIGRNLDYAMGLEGSLKLKEISYIHSEAYAAGELKHGTISLIEPGTLVVALATYAPLFDKAISNVVEVKSRGATVLGVTTESRRKEMAKHSDSLIVIPDTHPLLLPSLAVVPLQLFAYYVALQRGCDIDKPRNLAKSVTVE
ncbi:MAG: glutamine--fructose-6-phosphate transaminase (isomerizing) [Clostridiales bacterium]|nr:glutamine--fructose-6-phosphate transaminase (isomerizing) [Clostridiales bacterium]